MGWKRSLIRRLPVLSRLAMNLDALETGNRALHDTNLFLEDANRKLQAANRQLAERRVHLGADSYASRYEDLTSIMPGDDAVGLGPYRTIGQIELDILRHEGLQPSHTLVDLGCGHGRMAEHAIPYLATGRYIGIDVSPTMLKRAEGRMARLVPNPSCAVSWAQQLGTRFQFQDQSVDMICAYSVFTHIEHEDAYRYLVDAWRVVRSGGRFVFSCLPLDQEVARHTFALEAGMDLADRWRKVRCVATSIDFISAVARMAGWRVLNWYPGDVALFQTPGGDKEPLGQSVCVLERPAD
jgi:ubiquinone/menaquinone biosynthesis C-methylase UbiE